MITPVAVINRTSQKLLDIPIRLKLMFMITGVSVLTLVVATIMFIYHNVGESKNRLAQETSTIANIVGNRSTAALIYDDRRIAEENLKALSANEHISLACLYGSDGLEFVQYSREKESTTCPQMQENVLFFDETNLHVFQPVILADLPIGVIYIRAGLSNIQESIIQYIIFSVLFVPIAGIIAYLLSAALQGIVTEPILHLVKVAQAVTEQEDYTLRATEYTRDETGALIHSFNQMLEQIQRRDTMLMESKIAAETANRAKSQFLANINHELRTPLNAIIGFSEIIKNEVMGEMGNRKYRTYIKDIYNAGIHLLSVINDILDFSKAEAGEMTLHAQKTDIGRTTKAMVRLIAPRARETNIHLEREIPSEPLVLYTDEKKIKQILLNLLSNAVKFTEDGGTVTVRVWKDESNGGVILQVQDTGIGIAESDMERVMTPFGQVQSDLNRNFEGTGLGLPLTKKFTEAMNGTFKLESTVGVGTTITIAIPPVESRRDKERRAQQEAAAENPVPPVQ